MWWIIYAGVSCFLVIFSGIMLGLTLGLMSLGLVDLEILQRSGSPSEKKQAVVILPVVQKQHQLLVTLLLCNAAAMEALPIYLDKLFNPFLAVILSVTFVLFFGEVIPQAICSRYGHAVGANFVWLVRILMIICYLVAYPIGKVLDWLLGHNEALFRRAQLKALVSIHSKEAGKGGELTHDETTIISGALDFTEKTAEEAMTPIESTFSLDVNSKLDWEAMGKILARGHSRVPVYHGNSKNIIGLLLVKSLLTVRPEIDTPVSVVSIWRIPRVPANMPLYDILNEFQKGSSHMAAVVKASRKDVRKYDDFGLPIDDDDSLLVPEKKEGDQAEVTSGVGSMNVKNSSKNGSLRKRQKFNNWPDNETEKHNSSNSLHGDKQCGEQGSTSKLRKENQYKISNKEESLVAEGDDKLRKGRVRRVSLPGSRDQMTVETEGRYVDNDYQPTKRRKSIASHQALDGIAPLGSGRQLAFAATSSSSKVSGSHKVRTNFDDVKGSPVESVTSSPLRSSNLDKHVLTAKHISVKDDTVKVSHSSRRGANNGEGKLSLKLKGDKISNNAHPAPHKLTSTEYQVKEAKDKVRVQAKTSEIKSNRLLGVPVEEHDNSGTRHEEKVSRNNRDELSGKKPDKVTSLQSMEKNRRSGSQVGTDKMKVLTSESCFSKNGERHDSQVDIGTETSYDAKYRSPMSKCEIDSVSQKSALRHGSTETGKQIELKQKDFEKSVMNMDTQRCTGSTRKGTSQPNVAKDAEEENKANHVGTESRDRKSKVLLSADDEKKRETLAVPRYQKGDISNEDPAYAGNSDLTKLVRNSADSSGNVLVNCSSGSVAPGQQLTVSSPVRTSAQQTAVDTLEEATKQKERADHYKNSGFDFESNETYFEAGLKFLHGGSLLESCHNEISKHGEMSQMQIYATAAKLFKSCAHEYESRQEMAAAALAYKCMEVAYMRVVYCKHSSTNRDRCELQSTLQVVSQGESPSSSASDVDNLNNQVAMDKATLPKVTNAHVAGNHVISVRTRPSLLRLLDFTQDINFAMEAATKSHSTFSAANATMEETRNRDCITSIKRVIDFSFQDVGELVRLVRNATKAISGAGLGGARD